MNELLYHATKNPNLTPEDVGEILDLDHAMQDNYMEDRLTNAERELRKAKGEASDAYNQLRQSWAINREMLEYLKEFLNLGGVYDPSELSRFIKRVEESKHVK